MTRAADDFALIKRHIEDGLKCTRQIFGAGLTGHQNLKYFQDLTDAYRRLFTPRPLRELVAEGWREYAWVNDGNGNAGWSMFLLCEPGAIHDKFMGLASIPILTPQDMGVE